MQTVALNAVKGSTCRAARGATACACSIPAGIGVSVGLVASRVKDRVRRP